MQLPEDLLRLPAAEAVRLIALARLAGLREAAPRLDDPEDEEALHDFRVALRRLRSHLGSWRKLLKGRVRRRDRKRLRAVQVATGGGRDAEVYLLWLGEQRERISEEGQPGLHWLAGVLSGRLAGALEHARDEVRESQAEIDELLSTGLAPRSEVPDGAPRFAPAAGRKLRRHHEELAELLRGADSAEDEHRLHRARIATKRLRYLVEPLRGHAAEATPVVEACKRLQDLLGDINDTHVQQRELALRLAEQDADSPLRAGLSELQALESKRLAALEQRLRSDREPALPAPVEALAEALAGLA